MKNVMTVGAALLLTTSIASAGGLDRSGQPIGVIFEEGNYVELSFGQVTPDITGTLATAGGTQKSGGIAPDYTQFGFAFKAQINEQISLALIFDQPYGADVDYDTAGYILLGSGAEVESTGITALARYEIDQNFSVHGGLRQTSAKGVYRVTALPDLDGPDGPGMATPPYASTYSEDSGVGYVVGAAYERPEIALRVALTYNSEVDLELDGTVGDLSTTMPESVNLDFQTGIAADTLLFGSIRYVAWDGFALSDTVAGDILSYDDDVFTYNIGVGRRFSEEFSGSVAIGYETSTGDPTSNLGPTDGYLSLQVGGAYTLTTGVEVSGGVRFVNIGDADTTINAEFEDNTAVGVGLKVAYSF
ncbi:outer membrane protein transport protein [Yoonia sp. GPGPB17]|uniref:outer membrane protein transport protein n=1 Tax=Yoonia sp. GPGPB17 TaxID=3026147 RepID=UPI0030C0DAA7